MAEIQVATPQQEAQQVQQEHVLDCTVALNRYMFLRELNSHFLNTDDHSKSKMKIWSSTSADICKYLKKMVETDPLSPLNAIKKVKYE
jgi:hypothetical protein